MDDVTFIDRAAAMTVDPIAFAIVLETSESVPRRPGAMMVLGEAEEVGTVGGGAMESRIIEAMRAARGGTEAGPQRHAIDLGGSPQEIRDGICGGTMTIEVRRLDPERDGAVLRDAAGRLAGGAGCRLVATAAGLACEDDRRVDSNELLEAGADGWTRRLTPRPQLLVVGGGHCGVALARLASATGFDVVVQDDRDEMLAKASLPPAVVRRSTGTADTLSGCAGRELHVALVTRSFRQDLEALEAIGASDVSPASVGVMGSRRRLGTVFGMLRDAGWTPERLQALDAPIGVDIGAETPDEIAISILAGIVRRRSADR